MLLATALALGSAGLHAAWNLLVKTSDDSELASLGQFSVGGLLGLAGLAVVGLPEARALPWLAASACIHVVYVRSLVAAYRHGDFSVAYPLARGGGAMLAALGGVVLLGDDLGALAWGGIAIVALGLALLLHGHGSRRAVFHAAVTAATIASYTVVDSHGSRLSSTGARYGFALMPLIGVAVAARGVATGRGRDLAATLRRHPLRHLGAGTCLVAAYTMVLVAVRSAPVGYVTMLRESSVVLGALAGWVLLHERLGGRRLVSSTVILAGLALLVGASL